MMKKTPTIRVLHIASGDLWAGAEVQLFTLAKTLNRKHDINVSVILLNHGTLEEKLLSDGIKVIVLDETELNGFQVLLSLIRSIHRIQPDIVHTHRSKENVLGSIASLLNGNIPSLQTAHGAQEHKPSWFHIPKRLIFFIEWFCGRFLQKKIVAVSEDLACILRKSYPSKQITVIENGIDTKALALLTQKKSDSPQHEVTVMKVGIAGRLVPVKRVDLFIKAAQHLMQTQHEIKISFHIFGDGPLLDKLQQLSEESHTKDLVHFEGHCKNIHEQLQTLDALLMTSDHEGLPMILLEAMALQAPIIAHAVGGIPNLLDHGRCGILVETHDAKSYADAIYRLANDDKYKARLTQQALQRVNQLYSAEGNADKCQLEYKRLIK